VLVFEDLTAAEITAIQQGTEDEDFDEPPSSCGADEADNELIDFTANGVATANASSASSRA